MRAIKQIHFEVQLMHFYVLTVCIDKQLYGETSHTSNMAPRQSLVRGFDCKKCKTMKT